MRELLICSLLTGCATFTKPTNETRFTCYSGHAEPPLVGSPVEGDLGVAGCRLVQEGVTDGCIRIKVAEGEYVSADCPTPEGMR